MHLLFAFFILLVQVVVAVPTPTPEAKLVAAWTFFNETEAEQFDEYIAKPKPGNPLQNYKDAHKLYVGLQKQYLTTRGGSKHANEFRSVFDGYIDTSNPIEVIWTSEMQRAIAWKMSELNQKAKGDASRDRDSRTSYDQVTFRAEILMWALYKQLEQSEVAGQPIRDHLSERLKTKAPNLFKAIKETGSKLTLFGISTVTKERIANKVREAGKTPPPSFLQKIWRKFKSWLPWNWG